MPASFVCRADVVERRRKAVDIASGWSLMTGVRLDQFLQAHRALVVGTAAALPLLACVALSPFRHAVPNTNAALGLVLLIAAEAATGIRAAGLAAALSCAVWFDFFLTQPFHRFLIHGRVDIVWKPRCC